MNGAVVSEERDPGDIEILKPLIEDKAVMALIKQRLVPFSFIVKRLDKKPTLATAIRIARALVAMRRGHEHRNVSGVFELDVHFALVQEVLHVGGGALGSGRGGETFNDVSESQIAASLETKSRAIGREFASKRYEPLREMIDQYERVMRECERSINQSEALKRAKVDPKDWTAIKGWMNRFGLMRDPAYAKPILLDGSLAKEIEQRYVGDRLDEVVPALLRDALDRKRT